LVAGVPGDSHPAPHARDRVRPFWAWLSGHRSRCDSGGPACARTAPAPWRGLAARRRSSAMRRAQERR